MPDRRCVDDLSIEELEQILLIKKREARLARLRRMGIQEPPSPPPLEEPPPPFPSTPPPQPDLFTAEDLSQPEEKARSTPSTKNHLRDRILFAIELIALATLIALIVVLFQQVRALNQDVEAAQERPTPTATPLIRLAELPGGHPPPDPASGQVPEHLRDWVEPVPTVPIPTPGPQTPTRIVIPAIGVDAPIVEGVDWESLKKGVGHLIGSANPGERGNCFLAGHNDIYGEVFKDLDKLALEDEIIVYAGERAYRYRVKSIRIVEPDDTSVMEPTSTPVLTLLTCYPYMVDTHRLVVIATLEE